MKSEDWIPKIFKDLNGWLGIIRKIKDGSIDLEIAKENLKKSNLSEITKGKWEHKSEEQKIQ